MLNMIKKYQQEEEEEDSIDQEAIAAEAEAEAEAQKKNRSQPRYDDIPIRGMTDQEKMRMLDEDFNEEDYQENEDKGLRTSEENLHREIMDGMRKNMGLSPIPHSDEPQEDSDKFRKVPITKNGQDLPTIRETINDDQSREDMRDSLKDSLMPALRGRFVKGQPQNIQELNEEAYQESPSIDEVSDTTPKNQKMQNSQPGVVRAPQNQIDQPVVDVRHSGVINLLGSHVRKQESFGVPKEASPITSKSKIERVDTAHFNPPKVQEVQKDKNITQTKNSSQNTSGELIQSLGNKQEQFNFKQNMQKFIQIQSELQGGTGSTVTRFTTPQNVSTTQEHFLESSNDEDHRPGDKFSTVKSHVHRPQRVYGPQEPNLDVTQEEIEEQFVEPSDQRRAAPRESYPGNLSIKRTLEEDDEFMESTMDEKTLAAYMRQTANNRKAFPVKVNQPTEKPSATSFKKSQKGVSFVDEPHFMTQPNVDLEDTMAYDSAAHHNYSQQPQSIIKNKINRSHEVDQLADTMKSTEFESMPDFQKLYENLSQKPQERNLGVSTAGEIWKEASNDVSRGDYEAAYSKVLDAGDDIYLLRLLKITGSCMKKLNRGTALKLMKRIIVLQKSNFFDKMALGFFESAQKTRVVHNMKIEEQNLMLKELYKMSAKPNVLGETAANLHEVVNLDLKTTYI